MIKRHFQQKYKSIREEKQLKKYILHISIFLVFLTVIGFIGGVIAYNSYNKKAENVVVAPVPVITSTPNPTPDPLKVTWWNTSYSYLKKLSFTNKSEDKIKKGDAFSVLFDHESLVKSLKSLSTAQDLDIVYLDESYAYKKTLFTVRNPGKKDTNLQISLPEDLEKGKELVFFLYYGNESSTASTFSIIKDPLVFIKPEDFESKIGEEINAPIEINLSRKWILKGDSALQPAYKSSQIKVSTMEKGGISDVQISIYDVNQKLVREVPVINFALNTFTGSIFNDNLDVGFYFIQAKGTIDSKEVISSMRKINVSWPLYVNWSIDWEGSSVEDRWLQMMSGVANKYNVPMTHYFNPRHYTGGMTNERAKFLANWVLERKKINGDEIGLHFHMWNDMVVAAGVTPRTETVWGAKPQGNGYDLLASSYSGEEFDKMVKWAKKIFAQHGLPDPKVYRAGAWSVNPEHMQVLAKNGFKADTSGRTANSPGAFYTKQHPWKLSNTTVPYKPSTTDMNIAGKTPVNTIPLWEFPNNGENSSNYGINNTKLLDGFKLNYTGVPLKSKQVYSVLSHVQWFHNDEPVMNKFFSEISKHNASTDSGAVVYTTIENVIPEYSGVGR